MQMASFSGSGPLIKMMHVLAISCFKNRILLEINNKKPWKICVLIPRCRAIRYYRAIFKRHAISPIIKVQHQ